MADHGKTAELLWPEPRPPRRGPRPSMNLEAIADAGIAIADAEGVGGVTMAKVATSLGATKMSLYRYVPGRAELLAVMLDRAMGPAPDRTDAGGWRGGLTRFATSMYAMSAGHPWVFDVSTGVRTYGPNELGWLDAALGTLVDAPLSGPAKLDSIVLIIGHVRLLTAQHAASANTEAEVAELMSNVLAQHGSSYPHVADAFATARSGERDNAFHFGLERILDGLAVLIDAS